MFMPQKISDIKTEIDLFRKDVEAILLYTKSLEVRTKKEAKEAINYIARARSLAEIIEKKKLDITRDVKDYVSKVNNMAKEFLEPLALVEDMILQKIDSWKIVQQDSLELQTLEDEMFSVQTAEAMEANDTIRSDEATAYEETVFSYDVIDEGSIPKEYFSIDEKKLDKAIKNGIRRIPGLQILEEKKTRIRRRSLANG